MVQLLSRTFMVSKLPRSFDWESDLQDQLKSCFGRYLDNDQFSSEKDSKDAEPSNESRSTIVDIKIFQTKSNPNNCHALITLRYRNPSTQRNIMQDAPSILCTMFGRPEVRMTLLTEKGVAAELEKQRQSTEASKEKKRKKIRKPSAKHEAYKSVAKEFHKSFFLRSVVSNHDKEAVTTTTVTRSDLGSVFDKWLGQWKKENPEIPVVTGGRTQASVMSILRSMGLLKSKRQSNDLVICTLFASSRRKSDPAVASIQPIAKQHVSHAVGPERSGPAQEIVAIARDNTNVVKSHRQKLEEDKFDVSIHSSSILSHTEAGDAAPMVTPGRTNDAILSICSSNTSNSVWLQNVVIRGRDKKSYKLSPQVGPKELERPLAPNKDYKYKVTFRPSKTGIYKASVWFYFQVNNVDGETSAGTATSSECKSFEIVRFFDQRSGDANLANILKPKSKYRKKKRKIVTRFTEQDIPLPEDGRSTNPSMLHRMLRRHHIPKEVEELIVSDELGNLMQDVLLQPFQDGNVKSYQEYWQHLLWASEYQAKRDLTLFDMEETKLLRHGRYYKLVVPGLAEGRPSVLRGDLIFVCAPNSKRYMSRVKEVRQLDVILDLSPSFSRAYDPSLDTVDIQFTLSRTTFRTCHQGSIEASEAMGKRMLFPEPADVAYDSLSSSRSCATALKWGNPKLNKQQQIAVEQIVKGATRPLPYIVFGPPGTGKSVTMVEVAYQLAKHPEGLKILLTAPSNDAADLLVSKLAQFFPPTEMRRILAFSRSIDAVPSMVRPYCSGGERSELDQQQDILASPKVRIVVSTVNLAARFPYIGIPRGHFDVLCVDEAGHSTEPEVIGSLATLIDFQNLGRMGQVILAGDPKQLGPVVPSDLCEKFGMHISYMERLTLRNTYQRDSDMGQYPPHLLTKLINNYRSHPSILKLPNEKFYDNELVPMGDKMATHSLANWEHLPTKNFPIIFDSVHGENLREEASPSWFNPQEAATVIEYVKFLVQETKPPISPGEIGIITPYARQVQKIRAALLTIEGLSTPEDIKVGSVETFQGQERRVIIVSTVRAEPELVESEDIKYNLGFVANEKRFNVAMTRAQALLIVIGHPKVLATDESNWLPFLRYCKENNSWRGHEWTEVVDDDDEEVEKQEIIATYAMLSSTDDASEDDNDWVDVENDESEFVSPRVEQGFVALINREV